MTVQQFCLHGLPLGAFWKVKHLMTAQGNVVSPGGAHFLLVSEETHVVHSLDGFGIFQEWLVEPGQHVEEGQPIALLNTTPTAVQAAKDAVRVQTYLRAHDGVADCAVLGNPDDSLVAFVVPATAAPVHQLLDQVATALEVEGLAWMAVDGIPRNAYGTADVQALRQLAVADLATLVALEEKLVSHTSPAAVVLAALQGEEVPRLHLDDLAPGFLTGAAPAAVAAPVTEQQEEVVADAAPALSDGGPVPDDIGARTLPELLKRAAEAPEQGIVFLDMEGEEQFQSYASLYTEATRLAHGLLDHGLKPGAKVVLQCASRSDFLTALWGCILARMVPVPAAIAASYTESSQVTARIFHAWTMLDHPVILTGATTAAMVSGLRDIHPMGDAEILALDALPHTGSGEALPLPNEDDVTLLLMTSGSTGKPKLVSHSHASLLPRGITTISMLDMDAATVSLNWLPLDHVASIVDFHLRDVLLMCRQVQVPTDYVLGDPMRWLALVDRHRVTVTWAPNFAYALIADTATDLAPDTYDLSSMRHSINAGEAIVLGTAKRFLEVLAAQGFPGDGMLPAWGMSETASGVTYAPDFSLETADWDAQFMDLGLPIGGFAMRIVDEQQQLCVEGQVGRLQVRGTAVTPGYYDAPAQNAEVFTEDGWFKTGDLAMLREGRLLLTGREKDVIIIHGLNYYCHEIESVVEAVPGVAPSFTAAVAVRGRDGSTEKLAVFCHLAVDDPEHVASTVEAIRAEVLQQVGLYPEYVLALPREEIPKTGIGKIQRAQLRNRFHEGTYDALLKAMDLAAGNENTLPHWFLAPVWQPHQGTVVSDTGTGGALVFAHEGHEGMRSALTKIFDDVTVVHPGEALCLESDHAFDLDPGSALDYGQLFEYLSEHDRVPETVVFLWSWKVPMDSAQLLQGFAGLLSGAHQAGVHHLYVLTHHSQRVTHEEVMCPRRAALASLVRSAAGEFPNLQCRLLDVPDQEPAQAYLEREMCMDSGDVEVAWREGVRYVPRLDYAAMDELVHPLRKGGTYLVTGGMGGIGRLLTEHLLGEEAHVLVVGRSPANRHEQALDVLGQKSGRITYLSVDIAESDALEGAVTASLAVDESLDGIFHFAGIYEDTPFHVELDLRGNLRPKLDGLAALALLPLSEDGFLCAASSVLSRFFGAVDKAGYAAANRAVEAFCSQWALETGRRAQVLAFSGWDNLGLNAGFEGGEASRAMGYHLLSTQQGMASLLAGLGHNGLLYIGLDAAHPVMRQQRWPLEGEPLLAPRAYHLDTATDLPELTYVDALGQEQTLTTVGLSEFPMHEGAVDRDALARGTDGAVEVLTETQQFLCRAFAEVLGCGRVTLGDNFFALGGHSILALQLLVSVRDHLGVEVPGPVFLSGPTVAQLAREVDERKGAGAEGAEETVPAVEPIPEDRHKPFPLTDIQQAYHIGASADLELSDVSMHLYVEVEMDAPDHARLQSALHAVIDRHDMLRAVVLPEGLERILPEVPPYQIALIDLREMDEVARQAALDDLRGEMSHQKFDAQQWPGFDFRLALTGAGKGCLYVSLAALHIDGGSFFLVMREWGQRYRDGAMTFAPLTFSYRDYALALRNLEEGDTFHNDWEYWCRRLAQLPEAPALPYATELSSLRNYRFIHEGFRLDEETWAAVKQVAGKLGVSRSAMGLAAYGAVLACFSRHPQLCVNVTLFNRLPMHTEVAEIAGDFTSMVLAGMEVDAQDSFETLARRVQENLWEDIAHRHVSGVKLLRELARQRRQGSRALMPVIFTSALDLEMDGATSPATALRDFGEITYQMSQTPQVVLDCQLFEDRGELLCMVDAVEAAFPAGMIAHITGAMKHLLLALTEEANWKHMPELLPQTQAEKRALLNDTVREVPHTCMHLLFLDRAARQADLPAVIAPDRTLSYGQLADAARSVAAWLLSHGVLPNTLVAVVLDKGWGQAVATLGIQMAGAAYLPIDPKLPASRRAYLMENGGVRLALTDAVLLEEAAWPEFVTVCAVDGEVLAQTDGAQLEPANNPDDLAYVIFTSGSTGKPKGVMIEHAAAVNTLLDINSRFDVVHEDRVFALSSLSFDLSVYDLFGTFAAGAALVVPDPGTSRDPAHWMKLVHEHRVSVWNSVPALVDILVTFAGDTEEGLPDSLRVILMSGDWIPVSLPGRICGLLPEATVISMGGATEASIWSIIYPIHTVDPSWKSIPYGVPMVNQRWHVLDKRLAPCPDFVPGDLYIGGVGLARGYWADVEKTQGSFIRHPRTGERLYRTGDLGRYLPDGNIEFMGREDFQVKVQGFRIELGEIEAVLEEQTAVSRAVVVARGRRDEGKQLIAFMTGEALDVEALRTALSDRLPDYMVPANMVVLDAMPLSATGKVDRGALTRMGEAEDTGPTKGYVAPRNPQERELAALWCELLGLERLGMFDDLMQMGTNSLLAIKAVAVMRARLGVEVPLRMVLSGRATLADLAAEVKRSSENNEAGDTQLPKVIAAPEDAFRPFRFNDIQEAYWVGRLEAFELGGVAAYFYLEVNVRDLDVPRLEKAWQRVIDRHPMLRAVFLPDGTQQVLEVVPDYRIDVLELADKPDGAALLDAVRERMSHQVLPADRWPLFELRASHLEDGFYRLHFGLDLLIADAWSVQILFGDMERYYRDPKLMEDPLQLTFRDYLAAEDRLTETALYRRSKDYWWSRLDTLPPAPRLPMVKDFGEIEEPHFERFSGTLRPDTWRALTARAAEKNLSPSGLLLAAFVEVLGYWSRNSHFTMNVTTFNRLPLHPQAEHVVGDFTTLNLLEVDGKGDDFDARARHLQERLWEDLEHRYVGGLTVLRELGRRRGRKPGALAPIVFTSLLDSYGRSGDFVPLDGEVVYASSQTPQVWLDYQVREQDGMLYVTWDVVSELLPEGLPGQLYAAYRGFLEALAEDEDVWFSPVRNLLPTAQATLRQGINATEEAIQPVMLHQLFAAQAARTPDAVAVIADDTALTYGALQQRVTSLAHLLRGRGARPNQLIAVALDKGWEQAVATLAIMTAGGAYLPMDPHLPQARRDYLLEHAQVAQVVTSGEYVATISWPDGVSLFAADDPRHSQHDLAPLVSQQEMDDLAYVIFTSGSTGKPKGVMIEHRAACNTILDINRRFQVGAKDRIFALSALSFDLSVYDLFGAFACGAAVVFPPSGSGRDPKVWLERLHQHEVSIWNSVPALMNMATSFAAANETRFPDSLRLVMMSGDWIPVKLPERIREVAADPTLISMGGATEASIWSIMYPIGVVDPAWPSIPYGKPMANQRFHVLDESLEPCPTWVAGDLYIGGVGLARGYWGDEAKTAASFITHPISGERLYKTGDLGRFLPDGNIEFLGREDFQVKIQGFRIELGEIETVLGEMPQIQDVVVDAVGPDRENRRLVAYFVASANVDLESDSLRQHLATSLPEYMVPAVYMPLERLPLTANGKVDRSALPEPNVEAGEGSGAQQAATPLEKELAALWAEALEMASVETGADFFELGGNSLMAIRMISQVQQRFQVEVSLRDFFAEATVRGLAQLVARLRAETGEETRRGQALDLPTLEARPELAHEPFALNDIQQAYWMGRQEGLELGGVAAHFYFELELHSAQPERIEAAWRTLIGRHDMLRVVFLPDGRQKVLEEVPDFTVGVSDLREVSSPERQAALAQTRDRLSHQVLPTDQWPLFEIHVSKLEGSLIRAHFSFDLLLADAWSALLLFMEFSELYHHPDAALPSIELTYRDYMSAMARFPQSQTYAHSRDYWQKRVPQMPDAPQLPLKLDPSTIENPRFERRAGTLDPDTWKRLQQRAATMGLTPSGLLLAAYAEVLATWSTRSAFTINVTTFNRLPLHDHIEKLVGDFTSLTLLTTDGSGQSFEARATRIQQQLWEDLDHRFYSGIQVIRDIASHKGRAPGALMPVVFTSRLFSAAGGATMPNSDDGSPSQVVYSVSQTPQVWLDKQVFEEDGALGWTWDSVEGLFPDGLLDHMFSAYTSLLESLADDQAWQSAGNYVPETMLTQIAADNATQQDIAQNLLHAPFLQQVPAQPDAPAVIDGVTTLTYSQLAHRAQVVANHPLMRQRKPEELVAIVMDKGWAQITAALGVVMAGAAYLPIDPHWPADRRAYILERAKVQTVLTQSSLLEGEWPEGVPLVAVDAMDFNVAVQPVVCTAEPENLAYVIFTSGSTGRPKGVAIEHRAAANTISDINQRFMVGPDDRALAISSLAFDLSVYDLFGLLAVGGTIVVPPTTANPDPALWLEVASQHGVTLWNSVPALMELLVTYTDDQELALPESLRLVLLSGDWLPLDITPRLRKHLPQIEVVSLGGATEGSIWSIHYPIAEIQPEWASVPYGKALANQQMYVLDDHMQPRAAHVSGEIYIGGVGVAREYFADPVLTAKAYVPDPHGDGARLYKTGDLGRYLPDGNIEFLGRADFQVKVGGHRIELGEIEAGLIKHPALKAAVASAPWVDAKRGPGGNRRLVAFVVAEADETVPDADVLKEWLADYVPEYMIPSLFVTLGQLPLTANGKVDRKALPEPQAEVVELDAADAPATPTEARLAAIWKEILNLEQVSRTSNFFDLGGNSLLALKMLTRLREVMDRPVSLQMLFSNIQLQQLATALDELSDEAGGGTAAESWPQLTPDLENRHKPFPLTDVQQAYWIGRMEGIQGGSVAAHAYYELESRNFDLVAFQEGFRAMIARHDSLRIIIDGNGQQCILRDVPGYVIETEDLRHADPAVAETQLHGTRERMSHQVLTTEQWPIFEVRASLLAPDITRLHLSFDLLISDAWSSQVLFHELGLHLQGKGDTLEPLECSFRDYVLAEAALHHSERYQRSRDYWMKRLDTLPPAPELPLLKQPEAGLTPVFVRRSDSLDATTWSALKERASGSGLTPSGLLLSAFCEVLAYWSASPQFTLNLTTFNRMPFHPQVDNLMGDFTSLTLLAVDGTKGHTFAERARVLQEQLWADLDHRHMNGVEVMREMVRAKGGGMEARAPIVFTSRLFSGNTFMGKEEQGKLFGDVIYSVSQTPQVWLDHQVVEEDGALAWTWDAVVDLFPNEMVSDMFAAYSKLLQDLAGQEEVWAEATPLSPVMEAVVYEAYNPSLLHLPFFEQAARTPQASALISSARSFSYAELVQVVQRVAHVIRAKGVEPDTLVPIVMEKSWQQVVAALAVVTAGGAYQPIDAKLPPERIRHLLERGEGSMVLCQETCQSSARLVIEQSGLSVLNVDQLCDDSQLDAAPLEPCQRPDQLAYVIFTSGSTGTPKGVAIEHGSAYNTVADINERFAVGSNDRVLALSSLSFDLSVYDVFGPLAVGGALVLPDPGTERDPAHWAELMHRHQVTLWNSVPALLDMMVEAGANSEGARGKLPPSLRLAMMSGDWIPVSLPDRIRLQAPNARIISMGGATEASIWSIMYEIGEVDPSWPSIPYGFGMRRQSFHVLDHNLQPCPTYVPGELYIGGVGLAREYWRDEAKTEAAFITHPQTGQRLYRTGDHGRFLPGEHGGLGPIEFLGRQDLQVKILGHRVELGEIEAALVEHPDVATAVVHAPYVEGDLSGTGRHRRLVAYVVPQQREAQATAVVQAPVSVHSTLDLPKPAMASIQAGEVRQLDREQLQRLMSTMAYYHQEGLPLPKYRYASAGSLYPIQVYLTLKPNVVDGVSGGVYVYHPREQQLLQLADASHLPDDLPPLALHLMARMSAAGPIYPKWAWEFCVLEAGYMRNLLCEQAKQDGYLLHGFGGSHIVALRDVIGLEPGDEWCCSLALEAGELVRPPKVPAIDWNAQHIEDHVQRLTFKLSQPGLPKPVRVLETVDLRVDQEDQVWVDGFARRRSARAYVDQTISLQNFAHWLAQMGETHLKIYICISEGKVEGLAAGAWRYDTAHHRMELLNPDAAIARTDHVLINRPIHDTAGFMLFMVAEDSAQIRDEDLLEAGELGQIMQDQGHDYGLAACALGVMERYENIRTMFGLRENDQLLQNFIGGAVADQITTLAEAYEEQQAVIRKMVAELPPQDRANAAGADMDDGEAAPVVRALDDEELKRFLSDRLPHYMVPGLWMYLSRLPLTANGKVDRKALPQPDSGKGHEASGGTPSNELEQLITDLVASILSLDQVGTLDNFFELGANSLQLVQLQGKLQESLHKAIPITIIFGNPTVVALAAALEGSDTQKQDALEEGKDRARLRRKRGGARARKERRR